MVILLLFLLNLAMNYFFVYYASKVTVYFGLLIGVSLVGKDLVGGGPGLAVFGLAAAVGGLTMGLSAAGEEEDGRTD